MDHAIGCDSSTGRRTEGQELLGNDPIEIAVLDSLIVEVLFDVERGKVEETVQYGSVNTFEALENRQVKGGYCCGVSGRRSEMMI